LGRVSASFLAVTGVEEFEGFRVSGLKGFGFEVFEEFEEFRLVGIKKRQCCNVQNLASVSGKV
jgi:hypothetical protein